MLRQTLIRVGLPDVETNTFNGLINETVFQCIDEQLFNLIQ